MITILYSKDGILLLVQIDHLSGEVIGSVIDSFYEAGAKNVQVITTITKKNRPGYMIFVDTREQDVEKIEKVIIHDCGSSGWHRIPTSHRYTDVSVISKKIKVLTSTGTYDFTVDGKVIDNDFQNARPEYESCISLRKLLKENDNTEVPLRKICDYLTEVFYEDKESIILGGLEYGKK